jgi:hypothetical protein
MTGRGVKFDPVNQKFVADDEANKLIVRANREGYEING